MDKERIPFYTNFVIHVSSIYTMHFQENRFRNAFEARERIITICIA